MRSHAPVDYDCPICKFLLGENNGYNHPEDIVYRNELTTAFISPKWWRGNEGNVLVVPNTHHESLYNVPDQELSEVYKTAKKIAVAIRETYGCDGTSTRQHNEPAGDQDVWHFHVHVFPRFTGDRLYENNDRYFSEPAVRKPYADKIRHYLQTNNL